MKEIRLYDFALTENFGPVRINMTKDEVIDILGTPDSDIDFETGSSGLRYGWFEFFYWTDNKKLYAIQNEHLNALEPENFEYSNKKFKIDSWIFNRQWGFKEVIIELIGQNIGFEIKDFLDRKIIELSSGFIFDFDNETASENDNERTISQNIIDYKLIGFRYYKLT